MYVYISYSHTFSLKCCKIQLTPQKIFRLRRQVRLCPTPRPRPSAFGKNSLPLKIPVSAPGDYTLILEMRDFLSLYQSNRMSVSESVCVFVCSLTPTKRRILMS